MVPEVVFVFSYFYKGLTANQYAYITKSLTTQHVDVAKLVRHQTDNLEIVGPSPTVSIQYAEVTQW